jgi:serine/threonine protein kinase
VSPMPQGCPLPEARVRALFQQLITAVDYSHRLGVVSRDIKLDNMLLRCLNDHEHEHLLQIRLSLHGSTIAVSVTVWNIVTHTLCCTLLIGHYAAPTLTLQCATNVAAAAAAAHAGSSLLVASWLLTTVLPAPRPQQDHQTALAVQRQATQQNGMQGSSSSSLTLGSAKPWRSARGLYLAPTVAPQSECFRTHRFIFCTQQRL